MLLFGDFFIDGWLGRGSQAATPPASPNPGVSASDDILIAGSSDMAVLTYNIWGEGGPPNWLPIFRHDYTGSFSTVMAGAVLPGIGAAITLGRQGLFDIVANADRDDYAPEVRPTTAMASYDALVMDTSDNGYQPTGGSDDYWSRATLQDPYLFSGAHSWILARELEARMRLIRLAHTEGIEKIYLTSPWPRLVTAAPGSDAQWRAERFAPVEESMHWQIDRLNYQIECEGLGIRVQLIPQHAVIRRIYDDIEAGTAPSWLTGIRKIWANEDQQGDPFDPTINKHVYMLNRAGSYAMTCLFDRVVLGHDPRGRSATDSIGAHTIDADVAGYFQGIAVEIADADPRAGRLSAALPPFPIVQQTPAQILGSGLGVHITGSYSTGYTQSFASCNPAHVLAVVSVDLTNFPDLEGAPIFELRGVNNDSFQLAARKDVANSTATLSGNTHRRSPWGDSFVMLNHSGVFAMMDGQHYVLLDCELRPQANRYGYSQTLTATNLDMPATQDDRRFVGAHTPEYRTAAVDSLVMPTAGVTLHSLIVANRNITDVEHFNLLRALNVEIQRPCHEILTPDQVT